MQKNYNELEQKYSRAIAANPELNDVGGEFSSFISRLVMQVANLHGRTVFSDIEIKLQDRTVPGHKFVLSARSSEWSEGFIADLNEIGESDRQADGGIGDKNRCGWNSNGDVVITITVFYCRLERLGRRGWPNVAPLGLHRCCGPAT